MKFSSFILGAVIVCVSALPEDPHGRSLHGGLIGGLHKGPRVSSVRHGASRGSSILRGVSYNNDPHIGASYGGKDISYGSSSGPLGVHDSGYEGQRRITVSSGSGYEDPHLSTSYRPPAEKSVYQETSYKAPISIHGDSGYGTSQYTDGDYAKAPPKYEFGYGVSDDYHGTNFGHTESRDGYLTKGEYYVDLPDGRRQKVSYYVDEWGYHPTVTYEGVAQFPQAKTPLAGGYH